MFLLQAWASTSSPPPGSSFSSASWPSSSSLSLGQSSTPVRHPELQLILRTNQRYQILSVKAYFSRKPNN